MPPAVNPHNTIRLWCLTARDAPIVVPIVRYPFVRRRTHLLRWNYETGELEPGAWTVMRIGVHRCRLSSGGEFLLYHASGSMSGPFSKYYGGAYAVSRAPWIAALTHPDTFGPGGGGESRDALSSYEQARLWAMFDEYNNTLHAPPWWEKLGPGWHVSSDDYRIATQHVPGTVFLLVARHAGPGPHKSSPFEGELSYRLIDTDGEFEIDLTGIGWAQPATARRLLVGTKDGVLRLLRFPKPHAEPVVEQEHDLRGLEPAPRESPEWARAPLCEGQEG